MSTPLLAGLLAGIVALGLIFLAALAYACCDWVQIRERLERLMAARFVSSRPGGVRPRHIIHIGESNARPS